MMTPERYKQIGNLYQKALMPKPADRKAILERVCTDDEGLWQEVN